MSVRGIARGRSGDVRTSPEAGPDGLPKTGHLVGWVLKDVEAAEHHGHLVALIIWELRYPANFRCLVKEFEVIARVFVCFK